MGREKTRLVVSMPAWVERADGCLNAAAEDAYIAQARAKQHGAERVPQCGGPLRAAAKAMKVLEDGKASDDARCEAAERAARKYWEAKVCARQVRRGQVPSL